MLNSFKISPKRSPSNHLSDKNDFLFLSIDPRWYKVDYIIMLQVFYQINLLHNSLFLPYRAEKVNTYSITFGQGPKFYDIPCYFSPSILIYGFKDGLVGTTSKLLLKSFKSPFWRHLHSRSISFFILISCIFYLFDIVFIGVAVFIYFTERLRLQRLLWMLLLLLKCFWWDNINRWFVSFRYLSIGFFALILARSSWSLFH